MKFLVLALCVSAASAASFGLINKPAYEPLQPQTIAKAFVRAPAAPAVVVPVAAYTATKAVEIPLAAARTVYVTGRDATADVLRSETDVKPDGFNYNYETSNGIAAQAVGTARRVGNEDTIVIQGSYKYIGNDGNEVVVTYVADENGFQPQSNILPVAPAIPEAIQKSLAYIAANYKPEKY